MRINNSTSPIIGLLFFGTSSQSAFPAEKRFPITFFRCLASCCIKHISNHYNSIDSSWLNTLWENYVSNFCQQLIERNKTDWHDWTGFKLKKTLNVCKKLITFHTGRPKLLFFFWKRKRQKLNSRVYKLKALSLTFENNVLFPWF